MQLTFISKTVFFKNVSTNFLVVGIVNGIREILAIELLYLKDVNY